MKHTAKPTVRQRLNDAMRENYELQAKHLAIAEDTTKPRAERIASLHVIDAAQGHTPTPEADCDALLEALATGAAAKAKDDGATLAALAAELVKRTNYLAGRGFVGAGGDGRKLAEVKALDAAKAVELFLRGQR